MTKHLLLVVYILCIGSFFSQTLPPVAQALYTEFYNNDVTRGQYAVTNGAQAIATADGNSFYLKWIPAGNTASTSPLLVTMHGSTGNVFDEFYLWHQRAQAKGVGIIAIQWYRGAASVAPNDYFDDPIIYSYIDTALQRIKYTGQKVFLHGFSRGSARSYAVAFKDVQPGGKNYFCTILSNAGKCDSVYPIYAQINSGAFGHSLFTNKKWAMFCGGQDPSPPLSGCVGMAHSKNWVIANGGTVGLYISDPLLGHGGFHQTPAYIDSALNYYLQCYSVISGIDELNGTSKLRISPNPSSHSLKIELPQNWQHVLEIYNTVGIRVKKINIEEFTGNVDISDLSNGLYFLVTGAEKIKFLKE